MNFDRNSNPEVEVWQVGPFSLEQIKAAGFDSASEFSQCIEVYIFLLEDHSSKLAHLGIKEKYPELKQVPPILDRFLVLWCEQAAATQVAKGLGSLLQEQLAKLTEATKGSLTQLQRNTVMSALSERQGAGLVELIVLEYTAQLEKGATRARDALNEQLLRQKMEILREAFAGRHSFRRHRRPDDDSTPWGWNPFSDDER